MITRRILIVFALIVSLNHLFGQDQNVLIGLNAPAYGVKIQANFPGISGGWARSFMIANENSTQNFIGIGSYGHVVNGVTNQIYGWIGKDWNQSYIIFLPNGNVGIGTNNPTQKLEINGNIKITGYGFQEFHVGNTKGYIWGNHNYNGSDYKFQDDLVISTNWHGVTSNSNYYGNTSSWMRNSAISVGRNGIRFFTTEASNAPPVQRMVIVDNGNVGIGTTNPGSYKLAVEGIVGAREIKVTTDTWADFVFKPNYNLRPLSEVEQFIKANNHLPEIPSEAEVKENGIGLGEMNAKLLQKVEELTLYLIEQQKIINAQNNKIQDLENKINSVILK